jgi:ATP-dependent DNA helicase DinG
VANSVDQLIEQAFGRLARLPGFVPRENQKQLSLLISDCISGSHTGVFEAPTGLGKSLAALITAIAHSLAEEKRTVIATYTNVLAEQYLYKDVPLALSLFNEEANVAFLIGRQRYACVAEIEAHSPDLKQVYLPKASIGIESEFRKVTGFKGREALSKWRQIAVPQICPARMCDFYNECIYYGARRKSSKAGVVITNHSVLLMDASQGDSNPILGDYDFLVVDEAHDFPQAAYSAFEFCLDESALSQLSAISAGLERTLRQRAIAQNMTAEFAEAFINFRKAIDGAKLDLSSLASSSPRSAILAASPQEVAEFPAVGSRISESLLSHVSTLSSKIYESCKSIDKIARQVLRKNEEEDLEIVSESAMSYRQFIAEFAINCKALSKPEDNGVSFLESNSHSLAVKRSLTDVSIKLSEKVWAKKPAVCMSATLAIDGEFGFFQKQTGIVPQFSEIVPTPFAFESQASIYLPKEQVIPDPVAARKEGVEPLYYAAVASEIANIIRALGGRTLALFHSRAEMERVLENINLPDTLPIYVQRKSGAGSIGESFVKNIHASLFALRSFWTGFDAPGETLSCVALTRIPFEVPIDPPSIVRSAAMALRGQDPFREYSLANAKMLMRQGAGRLIRNDQDKGIIAILDPRVRTKNYGESILQNLPQGMRTFTDIYDAMASVGLETPQGIL